MAGTLRGTGSWTTEVVTIPGSTAGAGGKVRGPLGSRALACVFYRRGRAERLLGVQGEGL